MKTKIIRYEITAAQKQAIEAGVAALGEVVQAHRAANPDDTSFEIELKVTHERKSLQPFDAPPQTWGFFKVGSFWNRSGCGHGIDAALSDMFRQTDAMEKRATAERCRKQAAQLEREAAEMEKAQAEEAAAR